MDRIRLTTFVNQEMHTVWPYVPPSYMPPWLNHPNMPVPYNMYSSAPVHYYPGGSAAAAAVAAVAASAGASYSNVPNTIVSSAMYTNSLVAAQQLRQIPPPPPAQQLIAGTPMHAQHMIPHPPNINFQINMANAVDMTSGYAPPKTVATPIKQYIGPVGYLHEASSSPESSVASTSSHEFDARNDSSTESKVDNGELEANVINGVLNTPANEGLTINPSAAISDITRLALRGSEIAEKMAGTYRNRPCFKKIDSLCARTKQDLVRSVGVLPNINSQGIAWAVKDFIFVFTRIINAWLIIKGYVCPVEGLDTIKRTLSPGFETAFNKWQESTKGFIEEIILSFISLDRLVQSQKSTFYRGDFNKANNYSHVYENVNAAGKGQSNNLVANFNVNNNSHATFENLGGDSPTLMQPLSKFFHDTMNNIKNESQSDTNIYTKNYNYAIVDDSEGRQRLATANGTYFKTGMYNPLKRDAVYSDSTATNSVSNVSQVTEISNTNSPMNMSPLRMPTNPPPNVPPPPGLFPSIETGPQITNGLPQTAAETSVSTQAVENTFRIENLMTGNNIFDNYISEIFNAQHQQHLINGSTVPSTPINQSEKVVPQFRSYDRTY